MSTTEKKQVKVSEVLGLLDQGKSRKEIREALGLTIAELQFLFQNPKLKNKKAKSQMALEVVDDTHEETTEKAEEAQQTQSNTAGNEDNWQS